MRVVILLSRRTVWRALVPTIAAVLVLTAGPGRAAMDATAAQRLLDGTWVGPETTWVIDTRRSQVNVNPDKPFEWWSLQFVNVSGQMVIFDVGRMRCIALLATPDVLQVTSFGFVGERLLHRLASPPGAQADAEALSAAKAPVSGNGPSSAAGRGRPNRNP